MVEFNLLNDRSLKKKKKNQNFSKILQNPIKNVTNMLESLMMLFLQVENHLNSKNLNDYGMTKVFFKKRFGFLKTIKTNISTIRPKISHKTPFSTPSLSVPAHSSSLLGKTFAHSALCLHRKPASILRHRVRSTSVNGTDRAKFNKTNILNHRKQ